MINKLFAGTILTLLLGTMFFSLFHMSMGMDMSGTMTDCPFMSHEETICPMNLADHIGAWKSAFMSVLPSLTLLLAMAGSALLLATIAPNLLKPIRYLSPLPLRNINQKTYTFSHRKHQELFSNGILHPKLY